jgi:hypothetical protein
MQYNTLFLLFLLFDSGESSGHPHLRAGIDSPGLPEAYDTLTAFLRAEIAAGFRRVQK